MSEYKLKESKIEKAVVGAYKKIEKAFVDAFLEEIKDGEAEETNGETSTADDNTASNQDTE